MADQARDSLAMLAHELRSPIGTIVAAASGLERGAESLPPERQRALVQLVASEAKRLARLVEAVISTVQLDAGELPIELREIDASALVEAAAVAAQTAAPVDRSIAHEITGEVRVRADEDRLRQIVDNLIDNALKHAAGEVRLLVRSDDGRAQIEIVDDGPGIPADERDAIFEKFHRLDSPSGGTGLGLWLSRELVRRMNGTIEALDAPGGGARFVIELPAPAE